MRTLAQDFVGPALVSTVRMEPDLYTTTTYWLNTQEQEVRATLSERQALQTHRRVVRAVSNGRPTRRRTDNETRH